MESSWGFINIQVCQGINGDQYLEHFCILRVEHSYTVRKSEKSLDRGEPTCRENGMLPIAAASQSACFCFSGQTIHSKIAQKALNIAANGIRQFHWHHQISECTWGCPTPPSPSSSLFFSCCTCCVTKEKSILGIKIFSPVWIRESASLWIRSHIRPLGCQCHMLFHPLNNYQYILAACFLFVQFFAIYSILLLTMFLELKPIQEHHVHWFTH